MPKLFFVPLVLHVLCLTTAVDALVISEIHYRPPVGRESLEYVEVTNEAPSPLDISGYSFVEGIQFLFPAGTILEANGVLVVSANVDAVQAFYGIDNVIGNFQGRLDGGGERLTLVNHVGRVIQSVRYNDQGEWPVGPDGSGHSLVIKKIYLDASEPESWTQSPELGGSPGIPNFPVASEPEYITTVFVDQGDEWRYRKGTGPFSDPELDWTTPEFDDGDWLAGSTPFGYFYQGQATELDDMRGGYGSVAIRKRFVLSEDDLAGSGEFRLGIKYDDGFCAFLNGTEFARNVCSDARWNEFATSSHGAFVEEFWAVDSALLRSGENVLAIVGVNRLLSDRDFSLTPRVTHRVLLEEVVPQFRGRFNELFRGDEPDGNSKDGWLELFNSGFSPLGLGGLVVTDDPARLDPHVFPEGTTLAPRSFLVLRESETSLVLSGDKVQLFVLDQNGSVLTAAAFDALPPPGELLEGYAEARYPDGGPDSWLTDTPTPGAANVVPRVADIVINEIFFHPPEDRGGEFIELYHRGTEGVIDLSGFRFTRGIGYTFVDGTSLAAGEYLVLSEDPQVLRQDHGLNGVHQYTGSLANSGENIRLVDRLGNVVDEVCYRDGGRWSEWADGGGSSLELIDPSQDNDFAYAWDNSDETEKAEWENLSYSVPRYAPTQESELHILLGERGICRIDDVCVKPAGAGANTIPNPGFEVNTQPWLIEGTHIHSQRVTNDSHSGGACLELIATGKGDTSCNRIETDTLPLAETAHEVSLWARWQRGTSLLILHGEFAEGPAEWSGTRDVSLSNNSLGARLRMTVPRNLGTPGHENSVRALMRLERGSENLGPVIADVRHRPFSPDGGGAVNVVARIDDSDGVAAVRVVFKQDGVDEFRQNDLFDDGAHGDGDPGDGTYGGKIPGFSPAAKVVFFIEAEDDVGNVGRFPREAPDKTCLFAVEGEATETVKVVLDEASSTALATRRLHSNDLLDAAFVFQDDDVYYNVGLRSRGSPWGRPTRESYRIRFPKDNRFHRGLKAVNFSNRDTNDGVWNFLISRNGSVSSPAPASDYHYVTARLNGRSMGAPGMFETVDRDFLEKWYGDVIVDSMVCLKASGRLRFSDQCARTGWDEATLRHMDGASESYRFYWNHSIHQGRDNWEPWSELTRVMDVSRTSTEDFANEVYDVLDVEGFLRVLGPRILMGDGDALFIGNGHNGYMAWNPMTGWGTLPFDMGAASFNGSALVSGRDLGVRRLLMTPSVLRIHYRLLLDYAHGYWSDLAWPFFDALENSVANRGAEFKAPLLNNSLRIKQQLTGFKNVEFTIATNDGVDFETDNTVVDLEGNASVEVVDLVVSVNGGEQYRFDVEWGRGTVVTRWIGAVALSEPINVIEIFGFDADGFLLDTARIVIGAIGTLGPPFIRGDARTDESLNLTDAVAVLLYLFRGEPLECQDAADFNDNGVVEVNDTLALLQYLFGLRPQPPAPFPGPGVDPTVDALNCAETSND